MSGIEDDQEENPAEPVPDVATVAEPPQPPEPIAEEEEEVEDQSSTGLFPVTPSHLQSPRPTTPRAASEETSCCVRLRLLFSCLAAKSPASSSIEDVEPVGVPVLVAGPAAAIDASEDIAGAIIPRTERKDKFTQTFVKYTKNLPDKRLVEIINTVIDHEDKTKVFYCTSEELLRSFKEGFAPSTS